MRKLSGQVTLGELLTAVEKYFDRWRQPNSVLRKRSARPRALTKGGGVEVPRAKAIGRMAFSTGCCRSESGRRRYGSATAKPVNRIRSPIGMALRSSFTNWSWYRLAWA
jgi:hypothetical protein